MKKVDDSKFIVVPSVSLFREDVDSILDIFRKHAKEVKISDGNFEYDSIEELNDERGDKIKKLILKAFNPFHFSLRFDRSDIINGTTLYVSSQEETALTTFYQIKEILLRRKKMANYVFHPLIGIIAVILLVVILSAPEEKLKEIFPSRALRVFLLLTLFSVPILSLMYRIGSFFSINLKKAHESSSFLSRQKDDLIKLLIGAILGGFVTWLFTKN